MSGIEPPWPLSAMLAFIPGVIPPPAVAAVLAVLAGTRAAAVAGAVVTLVLAAVVLPGAWGSADPGAGTQRRVMTANLRVGGADPMTIVDLVREDHVDLLALHEFTADAKPA